LAVAAYSCGPGCVDRAIRRAGGGMNFWKIFQYLPRETRSYVPLYIAAAYIMTHHCDHNICPISANFSVATDTIMVEQALHFDQIAEILHIDKEAVRFYNPQYKREIIPGNIQPSPLRLPIEYTFAYLEKEDSVLEHRVDELLAHCVPVDVNDPKSRQEQITHTVTAGETVYTIANLYGVTAQNLRKWNGLSSSRVPQGRKLRVQIDNGGLTYAAQNTDATPAQPAKISPSTSIASLPSDSKSGFTTYQVQSGDTLSAIAKKYPGVTVQGIQQANGMTTTNLRIGQMLKIPKGA
jgi:membrane-bound lytic murein transglycosylase D